jgi:hypothetical protein
VSAWRAAPPVSNTARDVDRCEASGSGLTQRLNEEIVRVERQLGGSLAGFWGDDPQLAAELAPALVGAELSLATGLSRLVSDQHVAAADAVMVQDRLPRLRRLLRAGWVDWPKLQAFVHLTDGLDLVVVHAVERIVLGDEASTEELDVLADPTQPGAGLPLIARMSVQQLRTAIAAAIAAIDAEAAARRAKETRSARRVRCQANLDGTATLNAELTVEAAAAVWNALTAAAKAARVAGDPRSLDQLRADALVARTTGTPLPPPLPGDSWRVPDPDGDVERGTLGDIQTSGDPDDLARHSAAGRPRSSRPRNPADDLADDLADYPTDDLADDPADEPTDENTAPCGEATEPGGEGVRVSREPAADLGGGATCHACGQEAGAARRSRAGAALTVNLTLPLATYVGVADDPGQLDGYGPVAAGLARQIIRDAAHNEAAGRAGITWRCVVTDDRHGTVLGVGAPIHVRRHDPPPRLADLLRTAEPTCCFPGCRIRARDCDLDHRIPYVSEDPERGPTCSCNLQPLCRRHHRLKTAGLIGVRVVTESEEPGIVPGTLEFTTSTGLRYRRCPSRAVPRAADLDDPLIATAVTHASLRSAQRAADEARMEAAFVRRLRADPSKHADESRDENHQYDGNDRAWRRSLGEHTRRRLRETADRAARAVSLVEECPF